MKRKSTTIDLTPMVDLGFLLVSFFVFTSTLSQPKVMNINVPNDKVPTVNDPLAHSTVLCLLPVKDNIIYYYEGDSKTAVRHATKYGPDELRNLIMMKKAAVQKQFGSDRMVLIIKPGAESTMKNLVNLVDESHICMIKRYYIDEPDEQDKKMISLQ